MRHLLDKSLHQTHQTTTTSDVCTERLVALSYLRFLECFLCTSCLEIYCTEKSLMAYSKECVSKCLLPERVSAQTISGGKAIKHFPTTKPFHFSDAS